MAGLALDRIRRLGKKAKNWNHVEKPLLKDEICPFALVFPLNCPTGRACCLSSLRWPQHRLVSLARRRGWRWSTRRPLHSAVPDYEFFWQCYGGGREHGLFVPPGIAVRDKH